MDASAASYRQPSGRRKWLIRGLVVLILGVHFLLLWFTAQKKSTTSDEPFHIVRGISAAYTGDFRMSVAHPPLVNVICALPLRLEFDFRFITNNEVWRAQKIQLHPAQRKEILAGQLQEALSPEQYLKMILLTRIPVMLMSVALGALIWLAAVRLGGESAGRAGLLLYAFSPTVLAHGMLNTTDLGCALFMFIFAMALYRHLSRPGWTTLGLCGLTLGLAQLTKYTAVLLVPLLPVVLFLAAPGSVREKLRRFFTLRPGSPEFLTSLVGGLIMMLIGAAVIWAGYGFELHSIHQFEPPSEFAPLSQPGLLLKQFAIWLMAEVPLPPRTYYYGLSLTLIDTAQHYYPLYFMGRVSEQGWWYYYPALFLIKEPLSLLGLMLLSLILIRKPPRPPQAAGVIMAVFILGLLLFFMFLNQKNIGIRHLLPAYPLLFVWLSRLTAVRVKGKRLTSAVGALLAVYCINGIASYPDYLVHFNRAAGGPEGGLKLSVVGEDWGQDLYALGEFCKEQRVTRIHYQPYGKAWPEAYGIPQAPLDCRTREPGWYAVHVVDLRRPITRDESDCLMDFKTRVPDRVLHHTIYVFKIPEPGG